MGHAKDERLNTVRSRLVDQRLQAWNERLRTIEAKALGVELDFQEFLLTQPIQEQHVGFVRPPTNQLIHQFIELGFVSDQETIGTSKSSP
mgnify:CR=1 FL=1